MPAGSIVFYAAVTAVEVLIEEPEAREMLAEVGRRVADSARRLAPRLTGEGAASIQGVVDSDRDGPHVDVSWTEEEFTIGFAEVGTEDQSPTPFLVPGLNGTRV